MWMFKRGQRKLEDLLKEGICTFESPKGLGSAVYSIIYCITCPQSVVWTARLSWFMDTAPFAVEQLLVPSPHWVNKSSKPK